MAVSTGQDEKKKALNLAIAQIEKSCGKGSIMKMGADSAKVRIDVIPTGAINLDAAIGVEDDHANADFAARRGKLDRVADQVGQRL